MVVFEALCQQSIRLIAASVHGMVDGEDGRETM